MDGIETELAILRAAVRDPQTSDAVRSAVIDQQEDLLERRKELESELKIHLVNLENARRDPNGPSSSGPDRMENDDEEVQPRHRHRSKGKRRAFDDADRTEASNQAYGSTYIARTLPVRRKKPT